MSIANNSEHHLWVEKYRPNTIDQCILSESIKERFKDYLRDGRIPSLLLSGGAGTGKTTIARALANEMQADFMVINASMENSIDTVRTKIMQFASTVSFSDSKKITLLDEADFLSPNAQGALRNFMEEFSGNHSLILTCNYKNKIINPIHSRCHVIDFKVTKAEKPKLAAQFFKRITQILEEESIEYDKKVVAELVNIFFPDFRRTLNELQKYSVGGKIDSGILASFSDESFVALVNVLKNKKFSEMRKWVAEHADNDSIRLFRQFYDTASDKMEAVSVPAMVLKLSQYQYQAAFVADQEINVAAFCTDVMLDPSIKWK